MKNGTSARGLWVAVLGCAICCATPILAFVGAGASITGVAAFFGGVSTETLLCATIFVGGGVTLIGFWMHRRRANGSACEVACNADSGCCGRNAN
jgi:hypothetical protein